MITDPRPLRYTAAACAALAAVALLAPAASAAPAHAGGRPAHAADTGTPRQARPLASLTELSAQRLELADEVAAAKFGTDKPVDDPVREKALLKQVAAQAAAAGVDPDEAAAVFRDQIEANKAVQRGLFARWEARPSERPGERPDLAKEVRPALDRITGQLIAALRASDRERHGPACPVRLGHAAARTALEHRFDALHGAGLARAVPSVCASGPGGNRAA